jgi:hypothetical protein
LARSSHQKKTFDVGSSSGAVRTAASPRMEHEDGRLVPRPHLDPALPVAVGRVSGELELHRLCPKRQSTILVVHLDNDLAYSFDHNRSSFLFAIWLDEVAGRLASDDVADGRPREA